jgi:hypothetical protein
MESSRDNGRTLMRAQLEFASMAVDAYAQGAKFWWDFWGGRSGSRPSKRWTR